MTAIAAYPPCKRSNGLFHLLHDLFSVLKSTSIQHGKETAPETIVPPASSPEQAARMLDLYGNHILRLALLPLLVVQDCNLSPIGLVLTLRFLSYLSETTSLFYCTALPRFVSHAILTEKTLCTIAILGVSL